MSVKVTGLADTLKKLDKEIQRIKDASQAAFWEAGLAIIGRAQEKAPHALGNLRGSAYVRNAQKSQPMGAFSAEGTMPSDKLPPIGVEVGFYASYALAVHEDVEQKGAGTPRGYTSGVTWDTGEPKFLESTVTENKDLIPEIIKERTKMDKEIKI